MSFGCLQNVCKMLAFYFVVMWRIEGSIQPLFINKWWTTFILIFIDVPAQTYLVLCWSGMLHGRGVVRATVRQSYRDTMKGIQEEGYSSPLWRGFE